MYLIICVYIYIHIFISCMFAYYIMFRSADSSARVVDKEPSPLVVYFLHLCASSLCTWKQSSVSQESVN